MTSPPRIQPGIAAALRLLQASSCFRGDVCSSLPCACAETIARSGVQSHEDAICPPTETEVNAAFQEYIAGISGQDRWETPTITLLVRAMFAKFDIRRKASTLSSAHKGRPKVIGRVTGKEYDGDQVPGMPGAICHACGLKDYPCANPDCPNTTTLSSTEQL